MRSLKIRYLIIFGLSICFAYTSIADKFTRETGYEYDANGKIRSSKGPSVQTQLRVNLKDDTKRLHLINTTNDPDIITKTYILKHADPYEIRPYIRAAVTHDRITGGNPRTGGFSKCECIKYNDGVGALIVSAEAYRFEKQEHGMTIDEIVAALDLPKLSSSSGSTFMAYFPKYWDAPSLMEILQNSGLNHKNDPDELTGGKDSAMADKSLNALLFNIPKYQIKNVVRMLELYDTPTTEVDVKYTIYELDTENDGKIGLDYQSWKNGPGADLFSAAGRFSKGWDHASALPDSTGFAHTKFIKFSPKWNSRFIDFLTAKGKAKVITSGRMSIMTNTTGAIDNLITIPNFTAGDKIANDSVGDYFVLENATFWTAGTGAAAGNRNDFSISALTHDGKAISTTNFTGDISVSRVATGAHTFYYLKIQSDDYAGNIIKDNGVYGSSIKCYDFAITRCTRTREIAGVDPTNGGGTGAVVYADSYAWVAQDLWQTDKNLTVYRDVARNTVAGTYGFSMKISPIVCEQATTLNINISNTSLMGFDDDGSGRMNKSELKTKVMCSNKGNRLVIGGIDKKAVVRSVSKIPWFGSLPIVGWVLGSESESTKKTQIVSVLECTPLMPDSKVNKSVVERTESIDKATDDIEEINDFKNPWYGFDQFHFDIEKTKKGLDPLP